MATCPKNTSLTKIFLKSHHIPGLDSVGTLVNDNPEEPTSIFSLLNMHKSSSKFYSIQKQPIYLKYFNSPVKTSRLKVSALRPSPTNRTRRLAGFLISNLTLDFLFSDSSPLVVSISFMPWVSGDLK
jgi:hypothetical protein